MTEPVIDDGGFNLELFFYGMDQPPESEFFVSCRLVSTESDRGSVLVACAALESELGDLLTAHFYSVADCQDDDLKRMLSGFAAPLQTFSSRTLATFMLGLISRDTLNAIDRLRDIRNGFTHRPALTQSLDEPRVESLLNKLDGPVKAYVQWVWDNPDGKIDYFGKSRARYTFETFFRSLWWTIRKKRLEIESGEEVDWMTVVKEASKRS